MSEKPPQLNENPDKAEFLALAREMSEGREKFTFPGIDATSYNILKNEQEGIPAEYVLDIDAFIQELEVGGARIVTGRGGVYVCANTDDFDYKNDAVKYFFPRHLNLDAITDPKLKKLVDLSKIHPLI